MIDFKRYEDVAAKLDAKTESLWKRVTFISVADVISGEIDLRELDKKCSALQDLVTSAKRAMNSEVDKIPEEDYWGELEDEHNRVDRFMSKVDDKFYAIESVISKLREIEDDFEESEAASLFKIEGDITLENLNWISFDRL
jgi:hypothetical protein